MLEVAVLDEDEVVRGAPRRGDVGPVPVSLPDHEVHELPRRVTTFVQPLELDRKHLKC